MVSCMSVGMGGTRTKPRSGRERAARGEATGVAISPHASGTYARSGETPTISRPQPNVAHVRRLAMMGSALAAAVHDLRNALGAIALNLDSLDEEVIDPSGAIAAARSASVYSKKLLNTLHELGQPAGEARSIAIVSLVCDVARTFRASWPSDVRIEYEMVDPNLEVTGDELGLSRVFANLYANAAKAMSEAGGVISIAVTRAEFEAPTLTDTGPVGPGAYCLVRVSDTGCGIPEAVRTTMFQPFVTTNKMKGSGLGLAIAKLIVQDHGGGILVESQEGRGSTFTTLLPLEGTASRPTWNSILSIPPPATE